MEPSSPAPRSRLPNAQLVYWAAVIGMCDGLTAERLSSPDGHLDCVDDKLAADVIRDRPAHDPA
jgi:hypothetical protein